MYILVEIIHTEFQYISLIEIEKELRKGKQEKKGPFVPVGNTNGDKRVRQPCGAGSSFCPGCQSRDKRTPPFIPAWHSRLGNRDNKGFPTGTN